MTDTEHTTEPIWTSGGPGKSAYTDYRWECGCGHRYGNYSTVAGDVNVQHATHLAEVAAVEAENLFWAAHYEA